MHSVVFYVELEEAHRQNISFFVDRMHSTARGEAWVIGKGQSGTYTWVSIVQNKLEAETRLPSTESGSRASTQSEVLLLCVSDRPCLVEYDIVSEPLT